jgi:hypothetical protein
MSLESRTRPLQFDQPSDQHRRLLNAMSPVRTTPAFREQRKRFYNIN